MARAPWYPAIPEALRPEFEAERRRRTLEAVWAVNVIALMMYPVTTILDWVIAPLQYRDLSIVRFSETGALVLMLVFLRWMRRTGRGERWAYALAWGLAMVIAFSLDGFAVVMGGPGHYYYAGLTLLLTAVLVAYPWDMVRTGALVAALVLQFNVVLLLADPGWTWLGYLQSNYFYLGTIFIGLVWRITSERIYRQEFLQRKDAEAGRANLAATLRSIGDGVITADRQGRVVLMNRVAESLTGWTQDQAAGRPLDDVFHAVDSLHRKPLGDIVTQVLATGGSAVVSLPAVLVSREGVERSIEEGVAPIRDPESGITGAVLVFRDVTTKRRMEEELQRAHKLESVGLLAGGIAHDFNNLLTAIWGSVSLARSGDPSDPTPSRWLTEAEKGLMRARDLTQQLLTFSKGGAPILRTARIGDLITDSAAFSLRGSNVRCEMSIPADLWPVEVDESQMSQVISNLAINADEAMPDGGVIRVSGRNVPAGEPLPVSIPAGRCVEISLSDQGVGIPPELRGRVFDPYFTTKKKGSGLGLAICYSIVHKHGGGITLESEPGRGTTVRLYLPASAKAIQEAVEPPSVNPVGQGRVLVMDDDASLLDVCSQLLVRQGYQVQTVPGGAEAVTAYADARANGRPFDVVILDLTVPGGMGGREAARRILDHDPRACLVVASGYSNDPVMSEHRAYGFRGVIPKPYDPASLGRTLREILAEDRTFGSP